MIFITHPEHGADNVTETDLPAMEARGWKVTSRDEWMGAKGKKPAVVAVEEKTSAPVRRGRPPKAA